jgi:hypothetical protein
VVYEHFRVRRTIRKEGLHFVPADYSLEGGAASYNWMLGLFPEAVYSSAEIQVGPGERCLLYTDGILEAAKRGDRCQTLY